MRFISSSSVLLLSILSWLGISTADTQYHDENFVPDAVLRITQQNITQSCLASKSNVLVNGTSPGPELRLLEGQTYWIRVYNEMSANNLTMVCCSQSILCVNSHKVLTLHSTGTASQWPSPLSATAHLSPPSGLSHLHISSTTRFTSPLAWQVHTSTIVTSASKPYLPLAR